MNIKTWCLCASVWLMVGCSSAPEHHHEVNTYHNVATQLMERADSKRQAKQFDDALSLYQQAYDYSLKRHDKPLMVMSWLKSAAVHIQMQQFDAAIELIAKARQLDLYEPQDFQHSIDFVEAKLWWAQGKSEQALAVFDRLIAFHAEDLPRHIYYQLQKWQYQRDSMDFEQVFEAVDMLELLVNFGELDNIEIYSFAVYQQLAGLAETGDVQYQEVFVVALNRAVTHFTSLELSYSILSCYRLASDYFSTIGDEARASYYQKQVEALERIL